MKNTLLLLVFFFSILFTVKESSAQSKTIKNSFVIHGNDLSSDQLNFYAKSIEAADFEQFRLQTENVILKFKNGFNLELISAKDLVVRNIKSDLDLNTYTNYAANANYKYPLFEIIASGWITAAVETTTK
ncbi:MAG: hypothetical protein H7141_02850 [Burkholderiales bacterium]|nr:hypothetical protein [Bacteroidia bacterium]